MSRVVIRSVPFTARLAGLKGPDMVARDQARAKMFLAGMHPHGPEVSRRHRRKHHHGHHHEERTTATQTGSAASGYGAAAASAPAGSAAATNPGSVDATDAGVTYTLSVGVGNPPQQFTLLIDTGSSNTWVGAGTKYVPTSTSRSTGETVNVSYGSGSFSGTEYTDQVTLGTDLVIQNQSIGVASTATGFSDVDGILGIGPVDLTEGTLQTRTESVPTVVDNLYTEGTIPAETIGICYQPTTTGNLTLNGELTFGGTDSSLFTGAVSYVPITSTSPASQYWGIDQSVSYGETTVLNSTSGIVDTGTTLVLLATDAFQAYQQATGATMDSTTGLLTITEEQFESLQSLNFSIGGVTYELTANAQVWPRELNSTLGGTEGSIYLVTADLGSNSGSGLDFINGFCFLQRFYSVFDTQNKQVGLATTAYTDATGN